MPHTFIFIGRSGCGKGTQAELLMEHIKNFEENPQEVLYVETGRKFRDFIEGTSFSSRQARKVMERSDRQPDFLAVRMWSEVLTDNLSGSEHIIFDGTPRSMPEAEMLDTAMKFYNRGLVRVVHIDVSRTWSEARLKSRGRKDDKSLSDIKKRLDWFDDDVEPAIRYYEENKDYKYIKVNG